MRFSQGILLFRMKDTGTLLNDTVKARRIDQGTVEAKLVISGKVPFKIVPWQPSIDYSYIVRVWQEPKSGRVHWEVNANHDGFPSHEFFIESLGGVMFSKSYEPIWFSDTNSKTAIPSPLSSYQRYVSVIRKISQGSMVRTQFLVG